MNLERNHASNSLFRYINLSLHLKLIAAEELNAYSYLDYLISVQNLIVYIKSWKILYLTFGEYKVYFIMIFIILTTLIILYTIIQVRKLYYDENIKEKWGRRKWDDEIV